MGATGVTLVAATGVLVMETAAREGPRLTPLRARNGLPACNERRESVPSSMVGEGVTRPLP